MSEELLSLGLDVGTSTTQLILSRLQIKNRASAFAVPELEITRRQIRYQSPVAFTPLLDESHVDGGAIGKLVEDELKKAGVFRRDVDTGAVIITGETSRKENAAAVAAELSDLAGEFVVATAGPDLESVLAARGAGAVDFSEKTGKTLLHMDIGGGTSNLAWIEKGRITATTCLNVGGRLLKFDSHGVLTYVSPVLAALCRLSPGDRPTLAQIDEIATALTSALEMAAGLRAGTGLLDALTTAGAAPARPPFGAVPPDMISFSGGVADCIEATHPALAFGDMGPALGRAIRASALCRHDYRLGEQTIRATVIGAGCHSTQLSGSTVFCQNVPLPLKNLPVAVLPEAGELADGIRRELSRFEETPVLALPGRPAPGYGEILELARAIAAGVGDRPVRLALEQDWAKALGQALALQLGPERQVLCLDRLKLPEGSYLDVGIPVGPALPVVMKTLVFSR